MFGVNDKKMKLEQAKLQLDELQKNTSHIEARNRDIKADFEKTAISYQQQIINNWVHLKKSKNSVFGFVTAWLSIVEFAEKDFFKWTHNWTFANGEVTEFKEVTQVSQVVQVRAEGTKTHTNNAPVTVGSGRVG